MEHAPDDIPARDRLLSAATELFTSRGYAATSVREIVEGARVTKPVLYYYFRNKAGLYIEIWKSVEQQFQATLTASLSEPGKTARERITALCLGVFDLFLENQPAVRLMNAIFWGPPQGVPAIDLETFHRRIEQEMIGIAQRGIESGEFRAADPEDITLGVLGILQLAMDLQLIHPERVLTRERLLKLLDVLFTGVETPKKTRRS
ncbi:MAG: TetR/AcrR family transcriptional regulator [Acidobacteria bacterium]|nr:TetR/AcrR family transcriptional regulator [Acidobacteriota bacterium]MCG3192430.1 hypothetical protein [Thermoanaerobaculia bacterium]